MTTQRSRPRPRTAIGLDIGGTKIAAGIVTEDGQVLQRTQSPTPKTASGMVVMEALGELTDQLRHQHPEVDAIGVGAAGIVEWPSGYLRWSPNAAFSGLPLRQLLGDTTGLSAMVDNDANTAAWAEARFGNGGGQMAFLTVGTGIGGGLLLDGRLYRGKTGIGAEVGHLIVDPDGAQCGCGNFGCLEAMASGTALGRYGREHADAYPDSLLSQLASGAANVTGETVFQAARQGDTAARALFERLGSWLGIGIASLVTLFDFELVVIGGGLAATGDLLLAPTQASFKRFVFAQRHRDLPPIILARLGAEAGWIGAAALALDKTADDLDPSISAERYPPRRPDALAG